MRFFHLLITATLALCAAASTPKRVEFQSNGTQVVGFLFQPTTSKPAPIILLTQGLGGLQVSKLPPFAEKFASLGYNAMTFDYRFWGYSAGTPRNIINVDYQQADYQAAIAYVQTGALGPGVDPSRIVIWGSSLSGGNVLTLAPKLTDITAVICQVPHVNGPATVAQLPPLDLPSKIAAGTADAAAAAAGKPRIYIPTANLTGTYGALTQAGALAGYEFVQPNPPPPGNNFPAAFVLQLPFFSPDATAAESDYPTFMAVGLVDNIVSPPASLALAATMKNITLLKLPNAGHFDVYPGASAYAQNLAGQVAFLKKYVPL